MNKNHPIMEKLESLLDAGGTKKDIAFLAISLPPLVVGMFGIHPFGIDPSWVAIILCGVPIICRAIIGVVTEFDIKADVLVSLALIASVATWEIFAAGEVAFIMQLGGLLEELTVSKARAGIERLVRLTPQTARIIKEGKEEIIAAEKVCVGDIIRVLPGETVPVDGVVISGATSVNQAVMTGESLPVDVSEGSAVTSGGVNQFGSFDMRALKVGEDSSVQRMIKLVQSADAGKAKIVGIADRWATWVVVIALVAAFSTWLVTGEIIRAVTVLVVFCPCALVLATPTAIMAGIGNSTRHGFLVREGDALERLASVSIAAFDKTGTLTKGELKVAAIVPFNGADGTMLSENELYRLVAAAESRSEHPLGKAITACYREKHGQALPDSSGFDMLPGRGIRASVEGKEVLAGNASLFAERGVELKEEHSKIAEGFSDKGCAGIFIAVDGKPAGFAALSDTLREDAAQTIKAVKEAGVKAVLLTGDNEKAANTVAAAVGIGEVRSSCLPADKLAFIDEYQAAGTKVCMLGDGINDAPALKKAFAGIALGGIGSDIAVDAADIVLVDDEIRELPHLIRLSKRMMTTIKCNLSFSMLLNFAAIALAISGVLNPVTGALVHNAGSVVVIVNSALLLSWKKKGAQGNPHSSKLQAELSASAGPASSAAR